MADLGLDVGWVGTGRMGYALVERLLAAGARVRVWNRTRQKAEPLAAQGAQVIDELVELAGCDLVFTMVAASDDFAEVVLGERGLLGDPDRAPRVICDSSTVSAEVGEQVRAAAAKRGTLVLAAPVSGNPGVVRSGELSVVVSGPKEGFELARPYLEQYGRQVTYAGDGERARLVKICHNLLLAITVQALAEITVLAERGGVGRAEVLEFINNSVMGSGFTRYKTHAFTDLDFAPTFTGRLLRKDVRLGLDLAREVDVPLPLTSTLHELLTQLVGADLGDLDFAALLELEARGAGLDLVPESGESAQGPESVER